ncbi:ABC transporter permease [Solicola sp. PLA-1-18]|uniref:ABC transporter permease n=1 Tax=Solicola sp. PLA-1-18 TaxID=3380532 RepID=UPI003B7819C5
MSVVTAAVGRLRGRGLAVPGAVLLVFVLLAVLAPLVAPHDPNATDLNYRLLGPWSHGDGLYVLGTDGLGRDVLSRVIFGTRISLVVAAAAVLVAGTVGVGLALLAGWRGGWVAAVVLRVSDVVLSVPFLLLAILVVAVLGPSLVNVVVCLALVRWPRYVRVAYGSVLEARSRGFVQASTSVGASGWWIVTRHVLPEVLPVAIVVATLELGLMVLFEASLSFIGLGIQPPTASWGSMLSDGQQYISSAWWLATFPGLALFLLVLAANLLGDRARDGLDPARRAELRTRSLATRARLRPEEPRA